MGSDFVTSWRADRESAIQASGASETTGWTVLCRRRKRAVGPQLGRSVVGSRDPGEDLWSVCGIQERICGRFLGSRRGSVVGSWDPGEDLWSVHGIQEGICSRFVGSRRGSVVSLCDHGEDL